MDVVISGSRSLSNLEQITDVLDSVLSRDVEMVLVGGAGGVDRLAMEYCIANRIDVEVCFANWDELGKKAGMARNSEMLDRIAPGIDETVAIWDGVSKGTLHTIQSSLKRRVDTTIVIK